MSPRCRSWRFIGTDLPEERHLPVGFDHAAWKPCHAKVTSGAARCRDCATALITCPNGRVRAALANEPGVEDWILDILTTDGDAVVAAIARSRVDVRSRSEQYKPAALDPDAATATPWS